MESLCLSGVRRYVPPCIKVSNRFRYKWSEMSRCHKYFVILSLTIGALTCSSLCAQESPNNKGRSEHIKDETGEAHVDFVVRLGQGGFRDSRSPENKLGGGQLALDIKPRGTPIALSISSEYYTNSANPTHTYEISSLFAINILYHSQFEKMEKLNYFLGGGIGRLEVPNGETESDKSTTGSLINVEAGVHYPAFWKIGVYGVVKYLRAQKSENGRKVIDFNEGIVLLGFTFNFSL